ncbi:MAG: amidohydrolase family protein [Actinomycetota bacterium]
MDFPIIDADTHINEPPDLWEKRVPAKFRERAPRFADNPRGGKLWVFETRTQSITPLANAVGTSPVQWTLKSTGYEGLRSGAWDPIARLDDIAIDMVDIHVLFPTYVLAGASIFSHSDRELQIACVRAYNDWISEFASAAPDRLIGLAILPVTGVDDAMAEAKRVRDLPCIRGVMLTNWPSGGDDPMHDEEDRFWSLAEELDLAIIVHVGFREGGEVETAGDAAEAQHDEKTKDATNKITLPFLNQERQAISMIPIMSHFILGGILERHPRLRVAAAEVGAGWVPFFLEQTDDNYNRHRFWTNCRLPMLPSDYWYRQCFATFQLDRYAIRNRDLVGPHTMMWSSDYPHSGADWPSSRASIDAQMQGVPAQEQRMILCENALRLFGLTVDQVAGRVTAVNGPRAR